MGSGIHTDDEIQFLLHVLGNFQEELIDIAVELLAETAKIGVWATVLIEPDAVDAVNFVVIVESLHVVAWLRCCGDVGVRREDEKPRLGLHDTTGWTQNALVVASEPAGRGETGLVGAAFDASTAVACS